MAAWGIACLGHWLLGALAAVVLAQAHPKRSARLIPVKLPARVRSPGWSHSGFPRCRGSALASYVEFNLQLYRSY
jgi:hypothetical protein